MTGPHLRDIVKAYDIRGLAGTQLDERVATALGSAFAQVIATPQGHRRVAVGHDMRASSPGLAAAFSAGVTENGIDVLDLGLCSTDGLYYASGREQIPGAMITASHNPAEYNGLKLCRAQARPVGTGTGLEEVRDLAQWLLDRGELHLGSRERGGSAGAGSVRGHEIGADYAQFLHGLVDLNGGRELTVVIDAGNGMAGLTAPQVLGTASGLPWLTVIPLYFELDGTFPNHPANPLDPGTLVDLRRAVLEHGADLGLAFDGDADRCAVVDETGAVVGASAITALIAEAEIARAVAGGATADQVSVVHNLICSRAVPERIAAAGARAVRTRVGHSYIKEQMREHRAVFGGEHSAHYYFRDFWFADSGMLAALHVLAALGAQQGPLSRMIAPYQPYPESGEINTPVSAAAAALDQVETWGLDQGAALDRLDGLTLTWDAPRTAEAAESAADAADHRFWRVSLRPSNTEPLLRLNVEADSAATLARVRDAVAGLIAAAG